MISRDRLATVAALVVLSATLLLASQGQQPSSRTGWPCAGRPDPTYFDVAEGTGGHFFLFHPSELGDAGVLTAASMSHGSTLLRAGGQLAAGLHELPIPVDAVESLLFSISIQCLQVIEVIRPTGALAQASDPDVEYHQFEAGRVLTVAHPSPGQWGIRASGSRLFSIVVEARSELGLDKPEFVPAASPRAGVRQTVRLRLTGEASNVHARLVTQAFNDLSELPLRTESDESGPVFLTELLPPSRPFRIVVTGYDANGVPFQRVHAPLFGRN